MRKIYMIIAGAITIVSACTENRIPSPYATVGFSATSAALQVASAQKVDTLKLVQLTNNFTSSVPIAATITLSWNTDLATSANKGKINASISADGANYTPVDIDAPTTLNITIAAGENVKEFYIRYNTTAYSSLGTAKLNLSLSSGVQLGYKRDNLSITITAASPFVKAPSFAVLKGRMLTDTLWFMLNSRFYNPAPDVSNYSVKLLKDGVFESNPAILSYKLDRDSLGVVLGQSNYTNWSPTDDVVLMLILNKDGVSDTIGGKVAVRADKLANTAEYDFKRPESYFALLANKAVTTDAANTAKTDVVLSITGSGENYSISSIQSDSCKIAVVSASASDFDVFYRTQGEQTGGAQYVDYSGYGDMTNALAATAVSSSQYDYYAVKITYGSGANPKTHYGYLRLRTFVVYGGYTDGSPSRTFEKVELLFKYGEARNYTKE